MSGEKSEYIQKQEKADQKRRETEQHADRQQIITSLQGIAEENKAADKEAKRAERFHRRAEKLTLRLEGKRFWLDAAGVIGLYIAAGVGGWAAYEAGRLATETQTALSDARTAASTTHTDNVAAMVQAAKANSETNREAEQTRIESSRAWVGPNNASIDATPTVGKPVTITIPYQNTGKEPARDFIWSGTATTPLLADDQSGKLAPQIGSYMNACFAIKTRANSGVVYPSTGVGGTNINVVFKAEAIDQAVVDGKKMLLVQGCFAYNTFSKTHHSAFCYYWRSDISKAPQMNICENGNNAD